VEEVVVGAEKERGNCKKRKIYVEIKFGIVM